MKKARLFVAVCTIFAAVVGAVVYINVSAQNTPITQAQIEQIQSNCVSIKNTLNRLHASDALLRVNMGQIFESISTKLMDGFNGRVINNNLYASELVASSTAFNNALDNFRADYIAYEEQLSVAIDIDCLKQPVSFYDSVDLARAKRTQVRDDVANLNKYVDNYSSAVTKLQDQYFSIKAAQ